MQRNSVVTWVVKNPFASSLLILALLVVALLSRSAPLLVLCGLLAFARPIVYVALLKQEATSEASAEPATRPSVTANALRRASDRRPALSIS